VVYDFDEEPGRLWRPRWREEPTAGARAGPLVYLGGHAWTEKALNPAAGFGHDAGQEQTVQMAARDLTPLFWRDQEVGQIEGLKMDMFHIYGRWLPRPSPALDAFLEAVAAEEDVELTIGHATSSWIGSVAEVPGDEIDIRFRPPRERR
jgi:hypothetical protein